jgi:hypothetical protein
MGRGMNMGALLSECQSGSGSQREIGGDMRSRLTSINMEGTRGTKGDTRRNTMDGSGAPASISRLAIAVFPGALGSDMRGTRAMQSHRDMAVMQGSTVNHTFLANTLHRDMGVIQGSMLNHTFLATTLHRELDLMEGHMRSQPSGNMRNLQSRSRTLSVLRRRHMAVLRARLSQHMLRGPRPQEFQAPMILPGLRSHKLLLLTLGQDDVILRPLEVVEDWLHGCIRSLSRLDIMVVLR